MSALVARCEACRSTFVPSRSDAQFCPGGACKQRAYRRRVATRNAERRPAGLTAADLQGRLAEFDVRPGFAAEVLDDLSRRGFAERLPDGSYRGTERCRALYLEAA